MLGVRPHKSLSNKEEGDDKNLDFNAAAAGVNNAAPDKNKGNNDDENDEK